MLYRRLAYPEIIPSSHREVCLNNDFDDLIAKLRWALRNRRAARAMARSMRPAMAQYDWSALAPPYDQTMGSLPSSR